MKEYRTMEPNEYQLLASRTCPKNYRKFEGTMLDAHQHILHAHLGLSSETGELGDAIKKHFIYGQQLDYANVVEECGDVLWYTSLMLSACGVTMEYAMSMNIEKLKKRYPEKFTEQLAKERLDKV